MGALWAGEVIWLDQPCLLATQGQTHSEECTLLPLRRLLKVRNLSFFSGPGIHRCSFNHFSCVLWPQFLGHARFLQTQELVLSLELLNPGMQFISIKPILMDFFFAVDLCCKIFSNHYCWKSTYKKRMWEKIVLLVQALFEKQAHDLVQCFSNWVRTY